MWIHAHTHMYKYMHISRARVCVGGGGVGGGRDERALTLESEVRRDGAWSPHADMG